MTHLALDVPRLRPAGAALVVRLAGRPLVLWLASGALLLAFLGVVPVTRSQEARVLETAREMLDAPARTWLLPQVNGRPRMQKPPLAYWLTAGSYKLFGVSEAAGRAPAALAAWLTVGLTGAAAGRLFGRRAAVFAGGALLSTLLFFRHGRLAETDVLVMLFVTAGVWAFWRLLDESRRGGAGVAWSHLGAAAMALAVMSKGPAGTFPLLYLLACCAVERRWRPLTRFVTCGAPLTFLILASPWFAYVAADPSARALVKDLRNSVEGGKGHWDWPTVYVQHIALGVAPWTGVVAVALLAAVRRTGRPGGRRRRDDGILRGLLTWALVILIPLCLWGNKQRHYLLPLLPPLMILAGWFTDRALRAAPGTWSARAIRVVMMGMFVAALALVPAFPIAGAMLRGGVEWMDFVMSAVAAGVLGMCVLTWRKDGLAAGVAGFGAAAVVIIAASLALWHPTLEVVNIRSIAMSIRARYGDDIPIAFVRRESLPLCFNLRRQIPVARDEAQLTELSRRRPGLIAIEVIGEAARPATASIAADLRFTVRDQGDFVIGRVNADPARPLDVAGAAEAAP